MSDAEKKKLEQLKALKKQKKEKKAEKKEDELPKIKADALPPVMMQRKGQFEMVPDFLKQRKEIQKDQF